MQFTWLDLSHIQLDYKLTQAMSYYGSELDFDNPEHGLLHTNVLGSRWPAYMTLLGQGLTSLVAWCSPDIAKSMAYKTVCHW